MSEAEFVSKTLIADRYRLEEEIGHGAMGSVWRAWHLSLNVPVAVKMIKPALLESAEAKARFLREARAAASLRSTHVVQILDHGLHEDVPFIVMEFLEGESLAQRLEREEVLSFEETARIVAQVCRALSLAHARGIVHRDLKPDNIFLVKEGDLEVTKVLDFGIAKVQSASMAVTLETQEGAILGTPYYLSPEQAQGSLEVDHRSDLWALGVIAFECLTGRRPFESNHVGDLIVRICSRPIPVPSTIALVPEGFDEWFHRAASRDPEERFQSSSQLSQSLVRLDDALGATLNDSGQDLLAPDRTKSVSDPRGKATLKDSSSDASNGISAAATAGAVRSSTLNAVWISVPLLVVAGTALYLGVFSAEPEKPTALGATATPTATVYSLADEQSRNTPGAATGNLAPPAPTATGDSTAPNPSTEARLSVSAPQPSSNPPTQPSLKPAPVHKPSAGKKPTAQPRPVVTALPEPAKAPAPAPDKASGDKGRIDFGF